MSANTRHFDSEDRDEQYYSDDSHEREYDDVDYDDYGDDDSEASDGDGEDVPSIESLRKELEETRNRFSGATRKINEVLREKEQTQTQWYQERNQLLMEIMKERVKDLDPDEQRAKISQFQTALDQQTQLQQQQSQQQQQQQVMSSIMQRMAAQKMSQEYGVDEDELLQFRDPDSMKAHAESLAKVMGKRQSRNEKTNSETKKQRRRQPEEDAPPRRRRTPEFDSPAPVARRRQDIVTIDDAEAELKRLVRNARRSTV